MKSKATAICTVILLTTIIFIGCSKNQQEVTTPEQTADFLVSPTDLSTNVRLDEKIVLSFPQPIDPKVVESGLHLISQKAMADSTCPYNKTMSHGDMSMAMMDTMKMSHLEEKHSMTGKFTWNSNNTQCIFTPDSLMSPKMTYMVHLGKAMMDMMNQNMGMGGTNGGMMGGTSGGMMSGAITDGQMKGHMLMHFTTMDTTKTGGGGHLGHH